VSVGEGKRKPRTQRPLLTNFKKYPWVLTIHRYRDINDLLSNLKEKVIAPAEIKVKELREGKVK